MSRIAHVQRRDGRYVFRRRVHFRNLISKPLAISLQTADPSVARVRAALLAVRFAVVKSRVDQMIEHGRPLTGTEIEALFRAELERELASQVQTASANGEYASWVPDIAKRDAEAYRILALPGRQHGMLHEDRLELEARGFVGDNWDIEEMVEELPAALTDEFIKQKLVAIGAPVSETNIRSARTHIFRARADACTRTARVFDNDVVGALNPIHALVADLPEPSTQVANLLGRAAATSSVVPRQDVEPTRSSEQHFRIFDDRRFSEVIEEVIAELKAEGAWKSDFTQKRRIMWTFAWITGDRPLGSYNHTDVVAFKRGLRRLPVDFRFGTPTRGAMARPFAEVVAELPPVTPQQQRNAKTVNRDLSTMSSVAQHLAQTAWMPRVDGATIMKFKEATISVRGTKSTDLRPPWTKEHLRQLFQSPIFTGGGGAKRRLKEAEATPKVWHDAAYFAPLLWYYTHACREEICGLEIADVNGSCPVPYIQIQDNITRGRDGEKAGEKRAARKRKIPLHAELIRLGFLDYVSAIEAEGHAAVFPELYLFAAKRGGAQFYDRAWRFMLEWLGDRMQLPANAAGKLADIHSIRGLGSSFYEVDGVNEILRADLMGHAREGTNAKHYSKRELTEGLDVLLAERLAFMTRHVPVITDHVIAAPIQLLLVEHRSRVGSGRHRKIRSDAGAQKNV